MVLISFVALSGCADKGTEFVSSETVKSFPIPAEAKAVKSKVGNPNIGAYQQYKYSAADEIASIDEDYLTAIREAGWSELPEEQLGAVRFFEKEGEKVAVETHNGSITLGEVKN